MGTAIFSERLRRQNEHLLTKHPGSRTGRCVIAKNDITPHSKNINKFISTFSRSKFLVLSPNWNKLVLM